MPNAWRSFRNDRGSIADSPLPDARRQTSYPATPTVASESGTTAGWAGTSPYPSIQEQPSVIEITRNLIRQLRTVFQRALGRATRAHAGPLVFFHAGPEGLDIRANGADTSIEYHLAGNFDPALFAVPLGVLAECEGRKDEPVRIETNTKGKLHIHWQDGGIPRSKEVVVGKLPAENFPPAPDTMTDVEPSILNALRDAVEVSDTESSRYALGCLQLSGSSGKIAATDGRHLLVQSGYQFPWIEELLVPASKVFGSRELPADRPVRIGRTEKHVALYVGPWTIYLAINKDGRFPKLDDVVPAVGDGRRSTGTVTPGRRVSHGHHQTIAD